MDNQLNPWQVLAQHLAMQNEQMSETFQQALKQILAWTQPESTCTKARLPDPKRFDRWNALAYPQFWDLLHAKLNINVNIIGDTNMQIWYTFGRLTDVAAAHIHPWIRVYKSTTKFTIEKLFKQMDSAFADKNQQSKAMQKINYVWQGNKSFGEFLSEFDQLLLEAGAWNWDAMLKKEHLTNMLSFELQEKLVSMTKDALYEKYCWQVQDVADKLEALNQAKRLRWVKSSNMVPNVTLDVYQPPLSDLNTMDWEPTPLPVDPPHANCSYVHAKWVTKQELEKCCTEGCCLHCGGSGHQIKDCPYQAAQHPVSKWVTNVVTPLLEELDEEKESKVPKQGKE